MTVEILMQGALEPVVTDDSYHEVVDMLNKTAAKGNSFAGTTLPNGREVAFFVDNILTITEIDDGPEIPALP